MTDPMLVALVSQVHETRKGPKVWLQVLRGTLTETDEVEVLHGDGTVGRMRFVDVGKRPVTAEAFVGVGQIGGAGPFKEAGAPEGSYCVGDLVRAPDGVPVGLDPSSPVAAEIAVARSAGRNTAARHLSDAVVALHIHWTIAVAVKHSTGTSAAGAAFQSVAKVLAGYGLDEQADRALLLAAAVLEGSDPRPTMRGLARLSTGVAGLPTTFALPALVSTLGFGTEAGSQFKRSYTKAIATQGVLLRDPLLREGRAVALGWCKKCRDVTRLDVKVKCERCGKHCEEYGIVVPGDAAALDTEIRAGHLGTWATPAHR